MYVLRDKDLKDGAKLVFGELKGLCAKEGYAWISNETLAKAYNVHHDTISRWITQLSKKGYINVELNNHMAANTMRKITVTCRKNTATPAVKMPTDLPQKYGTNSIPNTIVSNIVPLKEYTMECSVVLEKEIIPTEQEQKKVKNKQTQQTTFETKKQTDMNIQGKEINEPKISHLNNVEIKTDEQINQLKRYLAFKFKEKEGQFPSSDCQEQFSGLWNKLKEKQYNNFRGEVVDNWPNFTKYMVEGIIQGRYNYVKKEHKNTHTSNQYKKDKPSTIDCSGLINLVLDNSPDWVKECYSSHSSFHGQAGITEGVNSIIAPVAHQIGFDETFKALDELVSSGKYITPDTLKSALNSKILELIPTESIGFRKI